MSRPFTTTIPYGPHPLKPLNQETRHGFDDEYSSSAKLADLQNQFLFYFDDKRHETNGNPLPEQERIEDKDRFFQPILRWKIGKERIKTVSAALILCLHLGVDPPDIVKTQPCARLEAWVDPMNFQDSKKAIEAVGKALQSKYELLSAKTKYKQSLDPCVEDLKRFCNNLRRASKQERILFHYNGHGVPKPTPSGEIWVFNRSYTQYIPVSLYDLQTWLGAPCVYVWDCNQAGSIIHNFQKFVAKRYKDDKDGKHDPAAPSTVDQYMNCYQLASCMHNELLPMNEELPADLFTACLTTPIEISVKVYLMQSPLKDTKYSLLFKNQDNIRESEKDTFTRLPDITIPGKSSDRRTPLGELNWIFTAITDTIAWSSLPRELFNKLFRHDLIVAALFRNFLLAKKLMVLYNCHPVSNPALPESISEHPLWKSWDLAIDQVLTKLIDSIKNPTAPNSQQMLLNPKQANSDDSLTNSKSGLNSLSTMSLVNLQGGNSQQHLLLQQNQAQQNGAALSGLQPHQQYSDFFVQNLTAFELWLKYGSNLRTAPEQLPIVLQVLLSQLHRSKALVLLSKFLDLGPWAVYLSLSIGIFPYVLKLLQGPSTEMKPILVFIWARIMSIDYKNTQTELIKEDGFMYFIRMISPEFSTSTRNLSAGLIMNVAANPSARRFQHYHNHPSVAPSSPAVNAAAPISDEQKAMAAFVLSAFVTEFELGQKYCFNLELIAQLCYLIEMSDTALLRQWCTLLLGRLYERNPLYKYVILAHKDEPPYDIFAVLSRSLRDPVPEVRTSSLWSITKFLSEIDETDISIKLLQDLQVQMNNIQQQLLQHQSIPPPSNSQSQHQQNSVSVHYQLQQQLQNIQSDIQTLQQTDVKEAKQQEVKLIVAALGVLNDGSPIVRKELVILLSKVVNTYMNFFIIIAFNELTEEIIALEKQSVKEKVSSNQIGQGSIFNTIWKSLLILSEDPHDEVKSLSSLVLDQILFSLNEHPDLGHIVLQMEKYFVKRNEDKSAVNGGSKPVDPFKKSGLSATSSASDVNKFQSSNAMNNKFEPEDHVSLTLTSRFFSALKGWVAGADSNNITDNDPANEISMTKRLNKLSLLSTQYGMLPKARTARFCENDLPNKIDSPLESSFFDYSKEYFQSPQMHKQEAEEPGSAEFQTRQWRIHRNDKIIRDTQEEKELSLYGDWSNLHCVIENKTPTKIFKFTQFDNYLVTGDDRDNIRCFDWNTKQNLCSFSNANSYGTKITDLKFLNEDDNPLLLICSSDGIMKIYKDFHDADCLTMISSWRGLTDMLLTPRSTGLLTEWQQSRGSFLVTGDVKVIRVWDALTESIETEIPAKTSSLVTSLTSDQLAGNIFVAGFSDGTLRCYDRRVDPRDSMVKLWKSGSSGAGSQGWINNVHMQRGGYRELVSGNNNGAIELWDIRHKDPVLGFSESNFKKNASMTTMQVHEHAPVIASGTRNVKLWTTSGDLLANFKNNSFPNSMVGTLTQVSRAPSYLSAMSFHPHRMMLAATNSHDTNICIYRCTDHRPSFNGF
ncbi:hypothetical protein ACO0QE_001660 [Hanseniaspora vineae]